MTVDPKLLPRLQFLVRVVRKESQHLATTDQRLFGDGFGLQQAALLDESPELAERVEAFVGRFGRLQDTLGDKLLPLLLAALGEKTSAFIDNLDRAERLGLLNSADAWVMMRQLGNQMVHEYIDDPAILTNALQAGHAFVPELIGTAGKIIAGIVRRGWAG